MTAEAAWRERVRGRDCGAVGWRLAGRDAEGQPFASVVLPCVGSRPGRYCRQTLTPDGLVYSTPCAVMVAAR